MRSVTAVAASLARNRPAMIALSLAVLIGLALLYKPNEVFVRLHDVDWAIALVGITVLAAVHLVQVELWRVMSVALNRVQIPHRLAVSAYFTGQAFGGLTPGNLGGDVFRTFAVKPAAGRWQEAAGPILAQRIFSYGTVFLLAALAGGLSLAFDRGLEIQAITGGALFAIVLGATKHRLCLLLEKASGRLRQSYAVVLKRAMSAFWPALGLSIAFHLASVSLMYSLLVSVGETPSLLATLAALMVARAVSLLPVTPYGLGLQEGSLVLLLPTLGVSPESALAVSLLARLAMLLVIGIGFACFMFERFRPRSESQDHGGHDASLSVEALTAQ
jgi:uncharacterized membrane protein YbhN (UPF0104 family)